MSTEKKAPTPEENKDPLNYHSQVYPDLELSARKNNKRRDDMPAAYRPNYEKAMSGKSLRAATKAFCIECVQWKRNEVRLCPSVACPLWLYRPYQDSLENSDDGFIDPESSNGEEVDD